MFVFQFEQYLLTLAILWGGYVLLTFAKKLVQQSGFPFLNFVMQIIHKVVLVMAVLTSCALMMTSFDIRQILANVREMLSEEMETFLRNGIEFLFNTRSFFVVIKILISAFVAFSTTVCGTAMLVSQLVCICVMVLRFTQQVINKVMQQHQSAPTNTTNTYNYQRKYFIRA